MAKRDANGQPSVKNQPFTIYPCKKEDFYILVIRPGRRIRFYGYCTVHCLGGNVRLDGFHMRGQAWKSDMSAMVPVCSPFIEGKPTIFEANSLPDEPSATHSTSRLKFRLKELTSDFENISKYWGNTKAAVLVINRRPSTIADLAEQIHGNIFIPYKANIPACYFDRTLFAVATAWQPYAPESMSVIETVLKMIDNKRREGERCKILPFGRKGAGKSTFLRHLASFLLDPELPPVYVLDCDVGQSELTPSGCLSLWKLDQPLLGQPWSHQKTGFTSCYFFGDNQVADNKDTYQNIFDTLLNEFDAKSEPGSVLLINTLGWLEGTGAEILQHMSVSVRPCIGLHLAFCREDPRNLPIVQSEDSPIFPIIRARGEINDKNDSVRKPSPQQLRELRMISYFSNLLKSPVMSTLSQAEVVKVSFSNATLAIPVDFASLSDEFILASINSQIVALCSTEEPLESRRLLGREFLPSLALIEPKSPLLKCHGFGLVRAIDLKTKHIIIHSPIPKEHLSQVTVIARGLHNPVPPIMLRSANAQPSLYSTGESQKASEASDLYSSLKTSTQSNFHRSHYPGV